MEILPDKRKSCHTNLLQFFEGVNKYVDREGPANLIHLDFQEAFDKLPEQRLIEKN